MTSPRARTPTQIARARASSEAIGRKIRALRMARGWTLEGASEAIHIDPRHLQRVEMGAVSPSSATLLRVADSLEVPVGALFDLVPLPDAAVPERAQTPRAEDGVDIDEMPARVGRRIAMLRHERGRTQAQLSRYETGEIVPDFETALGLQVIFGHSPRALFPGLYGSVEELIMNRAAGLERALRGKRDRFSDLKRSLLTGMAHRARKGATDV